MSMSAPFHLRATICDHVVDVVHRGVTAPLPDQFHQAQEPLFVARCDNVHSTVIHVVGSGIDPELNRCLFHEVSKPHSLHHAGHVRNQILQGRPLGQSPAPPTPRRTPFTKLPDSAPPNSLASSTASLAAMAVLIGGLPYFISKTAIERITRSTTAILSIPQFCVCVPTSARMAPSWAWTPWISLSAYANTSGGS